MVKFSRIINASLEWTFAVLFRPFSPKKWLVLAFIALVAGNIGGSFNFGRGATARPKKAEAAQVALLQPDAFENIRQAFKKEVDNFLPALENSNLFYLAAIPLSIVIIALILIAAWLKAMFAFVFLDDVAHNDASIKQPFRAQKKAGNSLFWFYVCFMLFSLFSIGLMIFLFMQSGGFSFNNNSLAPAGKFLIKALPFISAILLFIIASSLLFLVINDFVLVIMYKDGIKVIEAFKKAGLILGRHKLIFIKYIFIKLLLVILSAITCGIISFVALIGLILPGAVAGGLSYLLYLVIPMGLKPVFLFVFALVFVPLGFFLLYCLISLGLPFAVFFRTFSIKFFAKLEPKYNLFILIPPPEATPNEVPYS